MEIKKGKITEIYIKDMGEVLDIYNKIPANNASKSHFRNDFAGGSPELAIERAKFGTPVKTLEFTELLDNINRRLETNLAIDKNFVMTEDPADCFDISKVIDNEPECWFQSNQQIQKETLKINISVAMSCRISINTINNRGAAIAAIIDYLSNYYILDINIVKCGDLSFKYNSKRYKGMLAYSMPIANNPLDIDMLNFIISDPLFLRRLYFGLVENYFGVSDCENYGVSFDYDKHEGDGILYFGSSFHNSFSQSYFNTIESSAKWAVDIVNKFMKGN